MASAFWGGFASSLKGRLDQQYTQDLEMQKARALKELEKEFGAEIVDPQLTRVVGNEEIRYNKYGNEVSRRTLSPEELEARKLEMDKTRAGTRKAEADAGFSENQLRDYDTDKALDREAKRAQISSSGASAAAASGRLALDQRRFEEQLTSNQEQELLEAQQYLHAATASDDISTKNQAGALEAELQGAMARGDKEEVKRLIRQIRAELHIPYKKATTAATTRTTSGGIVEALRNLE